MKISFTTNEPTKAKVHYGPTIEIQSSYAKEDTIMATNHTVTLKSLSPETTYYFVIDLTDEAGNTATADNDGIRYSFTTLSDKGLYVPNPYPTIQDAIDNALDGDIIWVADGVYIEPRNKNIDFRGKAITVKSENGPENCIIDCKDQGRAFNFQSGEGQSSVLDGFTITRGYVSGFGGAINCTRGSNPIIKNCVITNNSARIYGGGVYIDNSSPTFIDCIFSRNSAGSSLYESGNGGGICNINSNPTLTNGTFFENSAANQGGAIYNDDYSNPVINNCTFFENSAKYGGGIYNFFNSNPFLTNCIFTDNSAETGGAIQNASSKPLETSIATLINCTLYSNQADKMGGGIKNSMGGSSILYNCILWDNINLDGTTETAQIDNTSSGQIPVVNYCCIQDWTEEMGGLGNINKDPLFFDPDKDDYHLKSTGWRWDSQRRRWHYDDITSPCIDAGNPGSPLKDELLTTPDDPTNKWGINLRINMGAYGGTAEASMAPLDWNLLTDLNNDGNVNMKDFAAQIQSRTDINHAHPGDLNRNGSVDSTDLALLANDWLKYIKPPFANITNPQNGDVVFGPLTEVEVEAEAWDTNGSVVKVEFFADEIKIGEDNDGSDGWKISWTEHPVGEYFLAAKATDNGGVTATSEKIVIWIVPSN